MPTSTPTATPESIPLACEGKPSLEPTQPVFDARDYLGHGLLFTLCAPCGLGLLSYAQCLLLSGVCIALPRMIRLVYPTFNTVDVLDDLRFQNSTTALGLASSTTLLLAAHDPLISLALKSRSGFHSQPLAQLLILLLCVEMALNGSSIEKEKIIPWLRWRHKYVHGVTTSELREELRMPEDVDEYGYTEELKEYLLEASIWAMIAFQTRFGRSLSQSDKNAIVVQFMCIGLRAGIRQEMLTKDYDSFLGSFHRRLDRIGSGNAITRDMVKNIEHSLLGAGAGWVSAGLVRAALMIGHSLLPDPVKEHYQLKILIYPSLMWMPLRGGICLLLVLERQLRPVLISSLESLHSMDVFLGKPVYSRQTGVNGEKASATSDLPSYVPWLQGEEGRPLLQVIFLEVLKAQISRRQIKGWAGLLFRIPYAIYETIFDIIRSTAFAWRMQIVESRLLHNKFQVTLPNHVGVIMDGNRRYARANGQPVIAGHAKGVRTAFGFVGWWVKSTLTRSSHAAGTLPRYFTIWAFSSENFNRPEEECNALFRLMATEFKSIAFMGLVHLFRIRVRVIGDQRHHLPMQLLNAIQILEEMTAVYDHMFLQIAVGYSGREEIVTSVQRLLAQGSEITEENISMETACGRIGIPPVDLIVRTSERRTSGFLLWDTQWAELHFIEKLWPQLTPIDWLDALSSFSRRERRGGR